MAQPLMRTVLPARDHPGEWAPDVLLVSTCGRPRPGDYGAWLHAGAGVACKPCWSVVPTCGRSLAPSGRSAKLSLHWRVPGLIYTSDLTFARTKAYVSRLGAALAAAAADRETARCGGVLWLRPPA